MMPRFSKHSLEATVQRACRAVVLLSGASCLAAAPAPKAGVQSTGALEKAATAVGALPSALRRAARLNLAADPYWHVLLHCTHTLNGWKSRIDDPKFFLAPDGKTNPAAELRATLRALFAPPTEGTVHAACRFPARLAWLRKRLHLAPDSLPVNECAELEKIYDSIDPGGAFLVFPAAFMNNPASMFGHTLINIKSRQGPNLLSHAVNYAATTRETNGLLFAFKGIFGLYKGYYSVTPYYRKVQEYSDIDQRDIWEYRLAFTRVEIHRMMRHIWELRNIYSRYYFFDENCSYALLFLLDAARPGLDLHAHRRPWVIPLDTIKAIRKAGLITHAEYRPSKATRVRAMATALPVPMQEAALRIADGHAPPDSAGDLTADVPTRARVLDLAAEYLRCRRTKRRIAQAVYSTRFLSILTARSALEVTPPLRISTPTRPDRGHGSMRLSLAMGYDRRSWYQELRWRPAYHDLLDPDDGYPEGSDIEFLNIALRHNESPSRDLELHQVGLLRILSISARNRFFKPISWELDTGMVRETADNGRMARYGYLTTGGGWGRRIGRLGLAYALLETDLRAGSFDEQYALGPGLRAGLLKAAGARWKVHLHIRAAQYALGNRHHLLEMGCAGRYTLSENRAIKLDVTFRQDWDYDQTEISLAWHSYF